MDAFIQKKSPLSFLKERAIIFNQLQKLRTDGLLPILLKRLVVCDQDVRNFRA